MRNHRNIIKRIAAVFFGNKKENEINSFFAEIASLGRTPDEWVKQKSSEKQLYVNLSDEIVELLKARFRPQVEKTISDAERLLTHNFNLLGSGPFIPSDSRRCKSHNGYHPIDWYLDPVQKLRFPSSIPHKEWDLFKMRPGNADIKLPWELSRCQHFVTLGQAFRLTKDSRYAQEIIRQIDDFMEANPVGLGINWTCTMDVAIRAANWAIGLELIKGFEISVNSIARAYSCLFDHGTFIYDNFENNYEVTSNHYLSNLVGLYFLSAMFDGLPSAAIWQTYCRQSIAREIDTQILPDGADFESSIPYHRLVLELFMGAARLAEIQNQRFSDHYYSKLNRMAEFLLGVIRPDGLMPVVGDADDGRLHIFSNYGDWNRQDARHALAPAAIMLDRTEWSAVTGPDGIWEAAWWGLDFKNLKFDHAMDLPDSTQHFPEAGLSGTRSGGEYLLISNSIVGTKGFGNHKHNDQLSFEFHCSGIPLIVDPGSHVYTSDFESRNMFRSTSYHNTVAVDGQEQNEFNPQWLFRMFEKAEAEHISFVENDEYVEYIGRHSGYRRFEPPLTHTRCFRFIKQRRLLIILDALQGAGAHHLGWHFHFAPNLKLSQGSGNILTLQSGESEFFLMCPQPLELKLEKSWYSPSYGVKKRSYCANLVLTAEVEHLKTWCFIMGPKAELDSPDFSAFVEQHGAQMSSLMATKNEIHR